MLKTAFLTILALQICLDRRGFSPNAMDGQYGPKTHRALTLYCKVNSLRPPAKEDALEAYATYFPGESDLFTTVAVTADDLYDAHKGIGHGVNQDGVENSCAVAQQNGDRYPS